METHASASYDRKRGSQNYGLTGCGTNRAGYRKHKQSTRRLYHSEESLKGQSSPPRILVLLFLRGPILVFPTLALPITHPTTYRDSAHTGTQQATLTVHKHYLLEAPFPSWLHMHMKKHGCIMKRKTTRCFSCYCCTVIGKAALGEAQAVLEETVVSKDELDLAILITLLLHTSQWSYLPHPLYFVFFLTVEFP